MATGPVNDWNQEASTYGFTEDLLASDEDEEDLIFSRIDLDSFCEPADRKLIHLNCNEDCSDYNEWTGSKLFAKVFSPIEESSLYDPELLTNLFQMAKQSIIELKMWAPKDPLEKRLSVTNLLHYTYSELPELDVERSLEQITSLLNLKQFSPSPQDSKDYLHGFLEWKFILALISNKMEKGVSAIQQLCMELVSYSIGTMGDSDIRHISPFPCRCFEALWKLIMSLIEQLPQSLNIWALIDESVQTIHSSSSALHLIGSSKGKYRDDRLTTLWLLRHFLRCMTWDQESRIADYRDLVGKVLGTFLDRDPPEADLRIALHELKIICKSHEIDVAIPLWDNVYKKINTNFKSINLDSANSLLVPNESAISYINKITQLVSNPESSNPTSYDLFLEIVAQSWKKAEQDLNTKYQQKLSNRILLKFSTKIWLNMNEMGIHNLINLLLLLYSLGGDERTLDRVEIVLLSVPFSEINHNRRLCVFKGLLAILILFYGKQERKTKSFPDNFMKKFENAIGVDRLTGRQMVAAMDTILSASEAFNNKEHVIINAWIKSYVNVCSENDREVILDVLTRIMEKYNRLRSANSSSTVGEEVIKGIYQAMDGLLITYLNADQEIEVSKLIANLFLCLRTPIQGIPLVDTLFVNIILNNVKNPRTQLKICNCHAEVSNFHPAIHVNNLIKAFIKFMLIIDGPMDNLKPLFQMIMDTKELKGFSSIGQDEFMSSQQPFQVFLKGIRISYNLLNTDAERDRFSHRFEMYFQMYTKWYLPYLKTPEETLKCYTNTTALVFNCGRIMYPKRSPNMLRTIICDFYLTSSLLLGKTSQPSVVVKAMSKVLHKLLEGLFHMEATQSDEYLSSVISDLIYHWPLQFSPELGVAGAAAPFVKFAKTNNGQVTCVLYERMCKILLTSESQRDVLAISMLKELVIRLKDDFGRVGNLLNAALHPMLEYYCKSEDFAPVKKNIIEFLEEISTLSFVSENMEISRVIDRVFEKWATTMLAVNSSNFFELAIKLARLFPVNLRLIMPRVRAEIGANCGQFGYDRLQIKLKNLESILNQK